MNCFANLALFIPLHGEVAYQVTMNFPAHGSKLKSIANVVIC